MNDFTSLEGPVEKIDGKLVLRIPMDAGGSEFVDCCRGISEVQEGFLIVEIKEWLAGKLRIEEGDLVCVSNENGKFNIRPSRVRPLQ